MGYSRDECAPPPSALTWSVCGADVLLPQTVTRASPTGRRTRSSSSPTKVSAGPSLRLLVIACGTDAGATAEWKKIGRHVLASVAKYQQRRLAKEEKRAQDKRKRQLRSLYNELTDTLAAAEHAVWPRVEVFCDLPSVVPLWKPAHAVVSPTTWSALKPTILADVRREMRTDKLYCFDLVARSLRGAGANLGRKVETALDHEPSIFVNVKNEVKGLAPLNAQLLTAVVNGVLARATALLACSACRCKLPYADMLEHLKDEHVWLAEASCEAAKPQFVALLRDCLLQAGKDEATTTRLELEELGDV